MRTTLLQFALLAICAFAQDITIYTDNALDPAWQNWSWGSTINYDATDLYEGTSSMLVNSTEYSALSLWYEDTFPTYQGLKFDIAVRVACSFPSENVLTDIQGAQPDLTISISGTVDNSASPDIQLSSLSTNITPDAFTSILINFNDLPGTGGALVRLR